MRRRNGPGQFSIRPNSPGPHPLRVQQDPASHGSSLDPMLRAGLPVGRSLLPTKARRRQKPRLRFALPGPAVVENPLEDAPNPKNLRCRPARSQPEAAWFLGAYPHETRHRNLPITFMKKSFTTQRTTPFASGSLFTPLTVMPQSWGPETPESARCADRTP